MSPFLNSPRPVKLRDSCHACAVAKVKCHREKPTCSRCSGRGIACKYVVTRRGGRKHSTRTTSEVKNSPQHSTTNHCIQPLKVSLSLPETNPSTGITYTGALDYDTVPLTGTLEDLDFTFFTNPSSPEGQSLLPPLADVITGFEALNAQNTPTTDIFTDSLLFESVTGQESSTSPGTGDREFSSTVAPLNQAVSLDEALPCCQASLSTDASSWQNAVSPTIEDTIDKNKQVLGALGSIMKCPCSDDGYLLTVISLIIYKVLGRGPTITPLSTPSSVKDRPNRACLMTDSHHFYGEDQDRMKTQSILGELHRVQSLINLLSRKLKSLACRKRENHAKVGSYGGAQGMPSISAFVIDQVGIDLRNRLQWLSKNIIERLSRD
ncbi:hypothetical protein GQX73_g9350 [Xylaria multiplex]|uniref:Zn(2)-C6 fungal-type domain-containing protein n=1 Tax=Xylaria multiplex TaxID=323545 RepID=A0A7C8MNU2_9PEZI|nr:hypothetical protein GQX73_g9350 [Xylaria multiplex]